MTTTKDTSRHLEGIARPDAYAERHYVVKGHRQPRLVTACEVQAAVGAPGLTGSAHEREAVPPGGSFYANVPLNPQAAPRSKS